jgi:hypothetical protein
LRANLPQHFHTTALRPKNGMTSRGEPALLRSTTPPGQPFATPGVPFLLSTGDGVAGVDPAYSERVIMKKPFEIKGLQTIIARVAPSEKSARR